MNLKQLIAEARRRSDDNAVPPFVSDEAYMPLASEAEQEACIRARLLRDDTTAGVATYAVTAGSALISLSPLVDVISAAAFTPSGGSMDELDLRGMDWVREQGNWNTRTSSRPCVLVHLDHRQARIWPTPSVAGTLTLEVYRLPLENFEDLGDEPEIPPTSHIALVDWMLYRVYGDKDGELYDPERSTAALQAFEAYFGERPTANVQRRQRERRRYKTGCL